MDKTNIPLKDIMTKNLICLSEEDTGDRIADVFTQHKIHHIPVLNEKRKLAGIVSRVDFDRISLGLSLFASQKKADYNEALYRTLRVKDIMTPDPYTLQEDNTLHDAYMVLKSHNFRAVPILSGEKLVGIVTSIDLLESGLNLSSEYT